MSTQRPECHICGADTGGSYLCHSHLRQLRRWLDSVPELAHQLELMRTRQHRFTNPHSTGKAADTPLPYHPAASDTLWDLANTLAAWAHDPHNSSSGDALDIPTSDTATTACAAARQLAAHRDRLGILPTAGQLYEETRTAIHRAETVCVPPRPQFYMGPCDHCGADLLTRVGYTGTITTDTVDCGDCGTRHELEGRRERLITQAENTLVTGATALSWALFLTGIDIRRATWDSWVARHRIPTRRTDEHTGRPLFRFGDALELATQHANRPAKTQKHRRNLHKNLS